MKRITCLTLLAVAASASAQPANPPPRAEFDAEVIALGNPPPAIYCGYFMATQAVEIKVTKVISGRIKSGRTTLTVMTCFGGHLMRELKQPGTFEIDPAKLAPKSVIHVDAEDRDGWFATDDKITAKP
jgi:hypothetical protein